jgi:hypothetical protein
MRKADGTLCADGSLTFTLTGTSTPSSVYAEAALSTDLGHVITLGSDARSPTPLWGDSTVQYRVELKDVLGATVAGYPVDDISGSDFGTATIPDPTSGTDGQVLGTDGSVYGFRDIREVPDGTGKDNYILSTVGNVSQWIVQPTIPDPVIPTGGITVSGTTIRIGDNVIQRGTGTLPASGSTTASVNITFGLAMDSCDHVSVTFNQNLTDGGYPHFLIPTVTSVSGTGCTVTGCNNIFPGTISSTIGFTYCAYGKKAV